MVERYRRNYVRANVTIDELEIGPAVMHLPPLPSIPDPHGQQCALCGLPAHAVETLPIEVGMMEDLLTNSINVRAVQKYRYVCGGPHEANDRSS